MSTVFVNISLSLDGYLAPEGMTMDNWDRPERWADKWGKPMSWALDQQYLREKLKLGSGGQTGPVNDLIRHTFERTGAHIMGRRMFDGGERGWPEEAPFHTPVFVLTHEKRKPWLRPGGTTLLFRQRRGRAGAGAGTRGGRSRPAVTIWYTMSSLDNRPPRLNKRA
jgi:dihydrofolate reductase